MPSADDNSRPSTPNFPTVELTSALGEQCFGIVDFTIVSSTVHEASARVALLEGNTVIISLSSHGYTVRVCYAVLPFLADDAICVKAGMGPRQEPREVPAEITLGRSYESIEDILTALSSRYADARQDRLFAKLQALPP